MVSSYDDCISATCCEYSSAAPQCVEAAEVDCRAASCAKCGGKRPAPELAYGIGTRGDRANCA